MGTRSLTRVVKGKDCLVAIYQQYDGYPSGVGADLKKFLKDMIIVDGYGSGDNEGTHANGMGCLSAQLIKHLKEGIGGTYIIQHKAFQEWNYDISVKTKEILKDGQKVEEHELFIKVFTANFHGKDHNILYKGSIKEMPIDEKYYGGED